MEKLRALPQKMLLNLEKLNELNSQGYAGKFCLGDTVVLACGGWEGGPRYVLEREAIFDRATNSYIERKCYRARKITD
ncbi:hypothetical protein DENIS_1708 [Desulfonema ishimotonii]|uniref:Uncharacterized protein n=1 Tax=Desulfonema ishimotonii TaxID=45657 RepID=A0A401FUV6_9BACT|nr:hypothetical protein [Desulfonema ishimotonii]GBC60749.1 hypothetical protein DENIS_1708 [Desulfonema ishimotonii]